LTSTEIWFSILQHRVLKYASFSTPSAQAQQVEGFIKHWNLWERLEIGREFQIRGTSRPSENRVDLSDFATDWCEVP
jgi:hypothetical protein